jgi:hypothetical protein
LNIGENQRSSHWRIQVAILAILIRLETLRQKQHRGDIVAKSTRLPQVTSSDSLVDCFEQSPKRVVLTTSAWSPPVRMEQTRWERFPTA